MPLPRTKEDMKDAVEGLIHYLSDFHDRENPEKNRKAIESAIASSLGFRSMDNLLSSPEWPPQYDERKAEEELRQNLKPFMGGYSREEHVIDRMFGFAPNEDDPASIIAQARSSAGFESIRNGRHPLTSDKGKGGVFLLPGPVEGMTATASVNMHMSETNTLRIVEFHHALQDEDGELAACCWGTAFFPLTFMVSDSNAIYGADETSDDDVRLVTSIVTEHPGFFEELTGIMHLDGLEVRSDLRGKGLATSLLAGVRYDMERRYPRLHGFGHSPERAAGDHPSQRVPAGLVDDVRRQTIEILAKICGNIGTRLVIYGQLPERGSLQTLIDVTLAARGGEPGMGTDLSEEQLEAIRFRSMEEGE